MNEHISRLLQRRWVLPTITGVVGAGIGALVGYKFTKAQYDRIEAKMAEIEEITVTIEEITDTIEFDHPQFNFVDAENEAEVLKRLRSTGRHPSTPREQEIWMLNEPADDLEEKRSGIRNRPVKVDLTPLEEKGKAVVSNIFKNDNTDEWDYKAEIETRDKAAPYIIHVDEFVGNELEYDQSTLTWYEKDQVLCDFRDRPIYNHAETVGNMRFGHGSGDANVVFVRNDRLQSEYEILRDPGSYEEIVLGEEIDKENRENDIKHSAVRKFRDD